ncbi:MAG: hypothetical protein WD578_12595 [Bacteroidales bacterium]
MFTTACPQFTVTRLNANEPILDRSMLSAEWTINGPSMLRIPDWVPETERADLRANYYIYFSGHTDPYIKLAWSVEIEGPYTIYNSGEGVFHLANYLQPGNLKISHHVASPDVIIDSVNQEFIMYFHAGILTWNEDSIMGQKTVVARSEYGLNFNSGLQDVIICPSYARIFNHDGNLYGLCKEGIFKAPDPERPWEHAEHFNRFDQYLWKKVANPFQWIPKQERHLAVLKEDNYLHVMYSRISTAPEHIEYSGMDICRNIRFWKPSPPIAVLYPEYKWEGISYPIKESENGSENKAQELRDPYLFQDTDHTLYLLYSGAGEQSLGIARVDGLIGNTLPHPAMPKGCPDSLIVFPNPSPDGLLQITGLNNRAIIEVYNLSGSKILNRSLSEESRHTLDLSAYHNETMIIHIFDESCSCWKKVILD